MHTDEEIFDLINKWTENTLKDNPEILEKSPTDIILEKEAIKRIYLQHLMDTGELFL